MTEIDDDKLIAAVRAKVAEEQKGLTPALAESVTHAENALGVPLDPFLKRVYLEVRDGGVGPGYGTKSLTLTKEEVANGDTTRVSLYATHHARPIPEEESSAKFPAREWPEGLLPVWEWGDGIWSCVDRKARIVTWDNARPLMMVPFTTRTFLEAWVNGVDMWKELFVEKEVPAINPFTKKPITMKAWAATKGVPWIP